MKILITTGIYPPSIGGPATYSKLLFDELPKRGIDVAVLSFDEVQKYPKIIRHIIFLFKIFGRVKGCDLVYAQDPVSVGLPSVIAAKVMNRKFFLRVGGDYAWEQGVQRFNVKETLDEFVQKKPHTEKYSFRVKLLRDIQTLVAKNSIKIISPSFYLKNVIEKWGIDSEKIKVIYNSFDEIENIFDSSADDKTLSQLKSEIKKDLGINGKAIVSVGRLVPWKGFEILIDSFVQIHAKDPESVLYIIGTGPDQKKLENKVTGLGLEKSVIMTGSLDKKTLYKYLYAADLFVLNTGYEGLSHVIIECMLIGLPVATTNINGNKELIEDGKNGLLFEYNNTSQIKEKILELLENVKLREQIIKDAKDKTGTFSKQRMLDELIKEIS
jgi:glycosyltransferase involved in cell wall biosynthesis